MNLMLIGNDTDGIAREIWTGNTNFTILKTYSIFDKRVVDFIKDKQIIISTTSKQFLDVPINAFIEYMEKYKFIPIFILDENKEDLVKFMYTAINEFIPNSVLYTRNAENKDYNEFIEIAKNYLNGKGMIEDEHNSIRAPRKRKGSSTKK